VFIDQAGVAFARAPELSGALYTRYVETGRTASVTEQFATTSTFAFLEDTHDTLERELNWRVRQFKVDQVGDVSVYLSGGSELLIAQTIPPTELVNAIRSVQSAPQYDDLTPGNFAYIDLRFGDKVFVSESGPPTDTDVATSTATTTANTTATTSQPETE
jgi:exo-beta-1,3-glucanase (GH17 family)